MNVVVVVVVVVVEVMEVLVVGKVKVCGGGWLGSYT